jgi:hypothetical protein
LNKNVFKNSNLVFFPNLKVITFSIKKLSLLSFIFLAKNIQKYGRAKATKGNLVVLKQRRGNKSAF